MSGNRSSQSLPREAEELFQAGFRVGYSLGVRYGQKDRSSSYQGISFIVPVDPGREYERIFRELQAYTPQPYELLAADSGASQEAGGIVGRSAAVRHIKLPAGNLITAVNRALRAARGEVVAVLTSGAQVREGWLHSLTAQLEQRTSVDVVYQAAACAAAVEGQGDSKLPTGAEGGYKGDPCCLLFVRQALTRYGFLDDAEIGIQRSMLKWLSKVPASNRICCDTGGAVAGPSR